MTDSQLTAQQKDVIAYMKRGWTLERVYHEFPYTYAVVPPGKKGGGVFFLHSVVDGMLTRSILTFKDGKIVLCDAST